MAVYAAKRVGVLVALALFASLVAVAPVGAENDEPGPSDQGIPPHVPDNTGTNGNEGPISTVGDGAGAPGPGETTSDEPPVGPVGFVDVPTYEAVRAPGGITPSGVRTLKTGENVMLVTFAPEDRSTFRAVLVIDGEEAASKYRFTKAVPEGHTAKIQADGSIRFFDAEGGEAGGIAPPWALDAEGKKVPTSFALDGDTLIQTVDHDGAAYPAIADPFWMTVVVVVMLYAPRVAVAATATYNTCARIQCGAAVRAIKSSKEYVPRSGSGGGDGSGRDSNRCNMRNRRGC